MEATARAKPADNFIGSIDANHHFALFTLKADVEPSVLPRVLQPFALRNLTPHAVTCSRHHDFQQIEVAVAGLSTRELHHLTSRLDQLVPVHSVAMRTDRIGPL